MLAEDGSTPAFSLLPSAPTRLYKRGSRRKLHRDQAPSQTRPPTPASQSHGRAAQLQLDRGLLIETVRLKHGRTTSMIVWLLCCNSVSSGAGHARFGIPAWVFQDIAAIGHDQQQSPPRQRQLPIAARLIRSELMPRQKGPIVLGQADHPRSCTARAGGRPVPPPGRVRLSSPWASALGGHLHHLRSIPPTRHGATFPQLRAVTA
jgi:hypothetical protein